MKITNFLIVFTIVLCTSCNGNQSKGDDHVHGLESHGHEHGDGEQHEHHQQEEFTISADSVQLDEPKHLDDQDSSEEHIH
jgi:hypothetical protein